MIIDKYPHIKELYRLGNSETAEGRLYTEQNQHAINKEYDRLIDENRFRKQLGGSEFIHKIINSDNSNNIKQR
jgi:hypothetical protein